MNKAKIILASALTAVLLASCGGTNTSPSPTVSPSADGGLADDIGDAVSDVENGVGDALNDAGNTVNKAAEDMKK